MNCISRNLSLRFLGALFLYLVFSNPLNAQTSFEAKFAKLEKLHIDTGVTVVFDEPVIDPGKPLKVIVYALPNGNTIEQTFGKDPGPDDDWHFNIQHIGAQTTFIREIDQETNYVVAYVANDMKSWPLWRRRTSNGDQQIAAIMETIYRRYQRYSPEFTLSGHSGGGSFIFGYMNAIKSVSDYIHRIAFLDATYGYEGEKHEAKLQEWLRQGGRSLQVIAYNDSVVVYNGKPLVSPTGGTWYRSRLMAEDLQRTFKLNYEDQPDRRRWHTSKNSIDITLIKNPEGKIFHTVLVEKNGFIHAIFNGTRFQNRHYTFWGERAYQEYVLR